MKQFYIKNFKSCVLAIFSLSFFLNYNLSELNAQILTDFPCYTVNENGAQDPNNLYEYTPADTMWTNIGEIDPIGDLIEAIATDPVLDIIYAYDAGTDVMGIINPNDPVNPTQFVPIDAACIGLGAGTTANGEYATVIDPSTNTPPGNTVPPNGTPYGAITLDDIDGLTYDPVNMTLYGTHRINSGDICDPTLNTNDLLFQIDIATGKFVPNAMLQSDGLTPADYAIVQEFQDNTAQTDATLCPGGVVGGGLVYDVDDIAYNPYTGELYAIQNQDGPGIITIINPVDGRVENDIYDLDEDDIEGLGFTYLGELYATSGNNGTTGAQNSFLYIDLTGPSTTVLEFPDPTGEDVDFESFDCLTAFNDLAIRKVLDPATTLPVYPGDMVTFLITVFNQGDFDNDSILITDYIPTGLTLTDPAWDPVPGTNSAVFTIESPVADGTDTTVSITFTIDPMFTGDTIANYAEISRSVNPGITDANGDPLSLPDIDSQPDATNNEPGTGNEVDDEINGGGPNGTPPEDEDDNDVAIIVVPEFDLALAKTLGVNQTTPVYPGQDVTFTITVTNQGEIDATQIALIDYIPTGFTLSTNDPNWTGNPATATIPGPITANGGTGTIDIILTVDPTITTPGDLVNYAER